MPPASTGWPPCGPGGRTLFRRLLYVAYFLEVGLLLMVLPWSDFWEQNYFVQAWPAIAPIATNAFVRGGVTGLGFVNLLAGVADLAPLFSARAAHRAPPFEPHADSRAEP